MPSNPALISGGQLRWLCTSVMLPNFMYAQLALVPIALNDSWLAYILSVGMTLLLSLGWTWVAGRFPGLSLPRIASTLLPGAGLPVALAYAWYYGLSVALSLRMLSTLFVLLFMPETPTVVFSLMLILLAISAVRHGPEAIVRLAIPAFLGLMVMFLFLWPVVLIREAHPSLLLPVLYRGPVPVINGALVAFGLTGELIALTGLYPRLNRPTEAGPATRGGILLAGLAGLTVMLMGLLVFGAEELARLTIPGPIVARTIRLTETIERIESLLVVFWMGPMFVRIALFLWAAVDHLAQGLGLQDHRPLVWPVGVLLIVFSLALAPDTPSFHAALGQGTGGTVLFGLAVPAGLWLLAVLRGKKGGTRITVP